MNNNKIQSDADQPSLVKTRYDEIDLIELCRSIWLQKWLIVKITSAFAVFSVLYTLSLDNIYEASVTMLPQTRDAGSNRFSGLVALAGVDLGSTSESNEAFYDDVLKSDKVLNKLIAQKWFIEKNQSEMFLYDYLKIEVDSSHFLPKEKLYYDTKKYLRNEAISFLSSKENGLMRLSVSMPLDPRLSANIANWLARELHVFNELHREKKALENLNTVKTQLDSAKSELSKAENRLAGFQKSNKNFTQSAELQLKYARLEREVFTENAVYTELRKQYEISKIDFEKSKETITILDVAVAPTQKSSPKRSVICILVTMAGMFFSIVFSLVKNKIKGI